MVVVELDEEDPETDELPLFCDCDELVVPAAEFVLCGAVETVEDAGATLLEDDAPEVEVVGVEDGPGDVLEEASLEVTDVVELAAGPEVAG